MLTTPKKRAPGAGRPLTGTERKQAYNVMLTPSVAQKLSDIGSGSRSLGIAIALSLAGHWPNK